MSSFLEQVWGDREGVRCVVFGKMRHTFFGDNKVKYPKDKDVWFAPALFDTDERKAVNVLSVKALWLDIDCGKPGTYQTQTEAASELLQFIEDVGLPSPTVVNSGNGLHVWWVLDTVLKPDEWIPLAGALREACIDKNLKADHGITIDTARIMRVPGTSNHKSDPPKPVELINEVAICDLKEITEALDPYQFKAELKRNAEHANRLFSVDLPQTPKDADRIADQCGQLRAFRDTRGCIPEPQWYAGLGLLTLCNDGEALAQDWSSGHKNYDPDATRSKFDRAREFAPTTCDRFRDVNPDGCVGCPFNGKITSPIQLGELETAVAPVPTADRTRVTASSEDQHELSTGRELDTPLPRGYICVPEGVFVLEQASEDEPPKKVPVLYTGVWVSRVFVGEINGQSEVEFSWYNSHGEIQTDIVANKKLATDKGVAEFFRGNNIIAANMKLAMRYIDAGIMVITRSQKEGIVYSKYGLHKKGFVVGPDIITFDGKISPTRISSLVPQERRDALCVVGSRDKWIEGTKLLDRPEFWIQRYIILAALASPIFALAEDEGSVLSIVGESGGGKTVAAEYGVSAYGRADAMTIEAKSTDLGFYHIWDSLSNLPVICNEASEIVNKQSIIYAAANGTSRTTSSQEGVERKKSGWKLLTIFTSNHAMLSLPPTVLNAATRYRILELIIEPENMISLTIGGKLDNISKSNYGHVGRELLQAIMPLRESIAKEVEKRSHEYLKTVDDDMRFGIWQVSAAFIVGQIARNLGLIQFEIDDAIENAIATLRVRTSEKVDPEARVMEFLNNYTNTYQESIGRRITKTGIWQEEPRGEARGKWRLDDQKEVDLCIAIAPFTAAALAEGIDTNYIKRWIKTYGVTSRSERLAGSASPVKCYVINAEYVSKED